MSPISQEELEHAIKVNVSYARKRTPNRQDDLISAGNFGIAVALQTFNPEKGVKFNTYARHFIWAYQNREYTGICKGMTVPSWISDYPRLAECIPNAVELSAAITAQIEAPEECDTETEMALEEALAELPGDDRELIDALFYGPLEAQEVARRMGVSRKTMYNRRNAVLAKLRKALTDKLR